MDDSNSVKPTVATTPQLTAMVDDTSSPIVRHLGFIKALAIIMAVLIVAALAVIIVTIYSRLSTTKVTKSTYQNELTIPFDSRVSSASFGENGQLLLVIEDKSGQQLWQLDSAGEIRRKTRIVQAP